MTNEDGSRDGPPLPGWVFRWLINPLMTLILYSPFHGWVSGALVLLEFQGRNSGKTYRFPVGYAPDDGSLLLTMDHGWWKKLHEPMPVRVRDRGEWRRARARATQDSMRLGQALYRQYQERGREFLERRHQLNMGEDQEPTPAMLAEQVDDDLVLIEVDLKRCPAGDGRGRRYCRPRRRQSFQ